MSDAVELVYHNTTDVLYITLSPGTATRVVHTADGHVLRLGPGGTVLGLQIADVLWRAGREGGLEITLPRSPTTTASPEPGADQTPLGSPCDPVPSAAARWPALGAAGEEHRPLSPATNTRDEDDR